MYNSALPLTVLAECFAKYPGIGMKTATRLAYQTISMPYEQIELFSSALLDVKSKIQNCTVCQNFTEQEVCPICQSAAHAKRDSGTICVVQSPADVTAFERTGNYIGVYHVLHGLISPLDGITPDLLKIRELLERLKSDDITEVIIATSPTVEGDTTAMYIAGILKPIGITVSRLAFGLPVGAILEQADEITLYKALENRNLM